MEELEFTGERVIPGKVDEALWYEHMARYIFAADFVKDKTVLDAGCGSGYGTDFLASQGAKYALGIDISPEAIAYAQAHYQRDNLEYRVMDVTEPDLNDRSFDVIVAFELIEHLQNQERFLAEMARVLKNDGLFIISTPNREVYRLGLEPNPFHTKEFNFEEFYQILSRYFYNVKVLAQDYLAGIAIAPVFRDRQQVEEVIVDHSLIKSKPDHLYFIALCSQATLGSLAHAHKIVHFSYKHEEYLGKLQAEFEDKLTWALRLNKEVQEKDKHLTELREELVRREERLSALEEELAQRQERITHLQSELSSWRDRVQRLSEELVRREERLSALEEELAQRQERITHLQSELSSWRDRVQRLSEELVRREERLSALEEELAQRQERITQQVEALRHQLLALQESLLWFKARRILRKLLWPLIGIYRVIRPFWKLHNPPEGRFRRALIVGSASKALVFKVTESLLRRFPYVQVTVLGRDDLQDELRKQWPQLEVVAINRIEYKKNPLLLLRELWQRDFDLAVTVLSGEAGFYKYKFAGFLSGACYLMIYNENIDSFYWMLGKSRAVIQHLLWRLKLGQLRLNLKYWLSYILAPIGYLVIFIKVLPRLGRAILQRRTF
jgi:SAM-dependent methyltransferase